MRALLLPALAILLAGCVATPDDLIPAGDDPAADAAADAWAALASTFADLPCDVSVGAGTSANLAPVAASRLDMNGEANHGELDRWTSDDGVTTYVIIARYSVGGFDIADITDPANPVQLASWDPEESDRALDVKFAPGGATVVVGGDKAISLVDIRDPAAPVLEGRYSLAKPQAHMITTFAVDNASYVAAPKAEGHDLAIYRMNGDPGARSLELVSHPQLTLLGEATGQDLLRSHDAWFTVDDILGKPLLWVANVWDGVIALDVSDPTSPTVIARIPNLDPYQGYTHTVQTTMVDGRRLVVAVNEVGANGMRVWDATDLDNPVLIATWHIPAVAKPQHNLQLVGTYAFVAHYDEGTFVFDLDGLPTGTVPARLAPVAHLAAPPAGAGAGTGGLFDGTWDVVVHRGLILTSEISHGLRVHAFGCMDMGSAMQSSQG